MSSGLAVGIVKLDAWYGRVSSEAGFVHSLVESKQNKPCKLRESHADQETVSLRRSCTSSGRGERGTWTESHVTKHLPLVGKERPIQQSLQALLQP
jgi:hypothetical protein